MTRINIIPVECLSNEHLLAEYRELPRVFTAVKKLIEQGKTPEDIEISNKYVLGKGHVKFFYTKMIWLFNRFNELVLELEERKFNIDLKLCKSISDQWAIFFETEWWNDYTPTHNDMYLNMARLVVRSKNEDCHREIYNFSGMLI